MNISNDTTVNRTRDLPARSAVPQPTEPPRREEGKRPPTPPKKIVFSSYIPYAQQCGLLSCVQTANPSLTLHLRKSL